MYYENNCAYIQDWSFVKEYFPMMCLLTIIKIIAIIRLILFIVIIANQTLKVAYNYCLILLMD